jgi:hypothetical protein
LVFEACYTLGGALSFGQWHLVSKPTNILLTLLRDFINLCIAKKGKNYADSEKFLFKKNV